MATRSVANRRRKYVLSAFNDYFILTGEFISGLHYRGPKATVRSYGFRFTESTREEEKEACEKDEREEGKTGATLRGLTECTS